MFQTKHPHRRTLGAVAFLAAVILVVVTAGGGSAAPAPPFMQCPSVGASPTCAILIELTDQGLNIFEDPLVGPFDGIEDTLVGVVNNSSATVNQITLSGVGVFGDPIFGLDGDGICAGFSPGPPACPYGPTGYEGPNTSFANISANGTTGDVVFTGGLAPGQSTYFSLEDKLQPQLIEVIDLTPATASNPLSTSHIVTATVKKGDGTPISGRTVTFSVDSGPDAGQTGTDATDANGQATFTVTNNGTAGTDSISASFVNSQGDTQSATATKTWTKPPVVALTDFRGGGSPNAINIGPDLCGTAQDSLNFTGAAGSGGHSWITVYDPLPRPPADTFGRVSLAADVQTKWFDNAKGAGLLALFNEAPGKKGLGLVVINNGNTDRLQLVTVDQFGKRTVLKSVALGSAIQQCVWYRVTMDVDVGTSDVTVTGQVFNHATPTDPDSAVTTQVGGTLSFTGPRPSGVDATGEVGVLAVATNTVVDSSVTNFYSPQ